MPRCARRRGCWRCHPARSNRHFDDRETLLRSLTERGFDALARAFAGALPLDRTPADAAAALARCDSLGTAYLAFARSNYGLWRLMFGPAAMQVAAPADRPSAFLWLRQALADLAAQRVIAQTGPEAELYAWSAIHGLCELSVSPAVGLPMPPDAAARLCRWIAHGLRGPG